ncbi:MAG: cysteine desulfurase NifS [Christensenellales bacterium]|jgi:cysteine desulfurase
MNKTIYMDHAATTPVSAPVLAAMLPIFSDQFGNPSSIHHMGRNARKLLDGSREKVAAALGADKTEIFFTGGGTEADNWALFGVARANKNKRTKIITSAIEHHAVLHSAKALEKEGFEVVYLPVDEYGVVHPASLEEAIDDNTSLVSIMMANNEIGTIEPIAQLAKIAHAHGAYFHTDAVQAVGSIPVNVRELDVDLLSLSAHKLYGPKGVGALYVKKGVRIQNLIEGGAQERNRRAGTENIPGIVGLAAAIEKATENLEDYAAYVTGLRDYMIDSLFEVLDEIILNGPRYNNRLPGNVNISIRYIEGEALLLSLDLQGICASSGSACTSGSLDPSHVLLAIGLPHEIAHGSLRLSLGIHNTKEEVDQVVAALVDIVRNLRAMSPLYAEEKGGNEDVF